MHDFIRFDQIDDYGPQEYRSSFDLSASELGREELTGAVPVTIEVRADKGDREGDYVAEGNVSFTAELTCSRCLEPYPFANTSSFHVVFRPRPAVSEENEEVEITAEEELDVEFYSERSVSLRELAGEQIQLSIPMKPLCEEGCLGLCSQCGANRNRETCRCGESVVDARWGALEDIRQQLAKKKEV